MASAIPDLSQVEERLLNFLDRPEHPYLSFGMIVGGYTLEKLYPEFRTELNKDLLKTTDLDFKYLVTKQTTVDMIRDISIEMNKSELSKDNLHNVPIQRHFGVLFTNSNDTLDILIGDHFTTLDYYLEWNIKWNPNTVNVNELFMKIRNKDLLLTKDFAVFTLSHVYAVVYIFVMAGESVNRIKKIGKILGRLLLILGGPDKYTKYETDLLYMNPANHSYLRRRNFNRDIIKEITSLMDTYYGTPQLFIYLCEKVKKLYASQLRSHHFNPRIEDYEHPNYTDIHRLRDPKIPLMKKQYAGGKDNKSNSKNGLQKIDFILDEYLYSVDESIKIAKSHEGVTDTEKFITDYNNSLINLFEDEKEPSKNSHIQPLNQNTIEVQAGGKRKSKKYTKTYKKDKSTKKQSTKKTDKTYKKAKLNKTNKKRV
jgi:hypothetical protein